LADAASPQEGTRWLVGVRLRLNADDLALSVLEDTMALGRDEVIDQLVQLVDHLGRPADALAPSPGRSGRPRLVAAFARSLQIAPPSNSNLHDFVAAARRKYFPRLGWTPALWAPYGVALR
jgi:hypothetical protein